MTPVCRTIATLVVMTLVGAAALRLPAEAMESAAVTEAAGLHGHMHGLVWRVGKYSALVRMGEETLSYTRKFPAFTDQEPDRKENTKIANRIDYYLSQQQDVKGLLIYVGWREIEPQQGVYDWDFLDKVVKAKPGKITDFTEIFLAAFKTTPGVLWKARKMLW